MNDAATHAPPKNLLCAVYTRKSTDENLNSDFTSLDSQREYCQSFVKSREGEGWRVYQGDYNDPGFSGGNMDRPGLRKLLADARARKFHAVVCYKYDRLSRNTKDFLAILDVFDKHGVAFVSVTQPIDTTSSVGRLMRSILVDFAQFEREMISERTRDKLFSMAQRGKRTGGHPILGFDIDKQKKTLSTNSTESKQAIEMFETYVATKSLSVTAKNLNEKGYRMKYWETRSGNSRGGKRFNKATIFNLLRNPLYIGKIVHRKKVYDGEHEGIIPENLFNDVAALLTKNGNGKVFKDGYELKHNFVLRGLIKCAVCGTSMTPHSSRNRHKQKFFYYRCISVNKLDRTACSIRHVWAKTLEEHVLKRLGQLGENKELVEKVVAEARTASSTELPIKRDERKRHATEFLRKENAVKNLLAHLAQESPDSKRRAPILGEIDTYMAGQEEIKTRLVTLDEEIVELEKREIDAEVVRRNLANFTKLYSRLSPTDQRELMQLLLRGVIFDGKASRITLELNPLPDVWAGWTNTEDVFVERQTSLRD